MAILLGMTRSQANTLKREQEFQRRQRETERARKALAALNSPRPA
jgi:hypothetical protein